jgi:hypothetical protein
MWDASVRKSNTPKRNHKTNTNPRTKSNINGDVGSL